LNLSTVARHAACAAILSVLAACGGGGGADGGGTSAAPAAAAAPAITTQPADASAVTGSAAVFSVVASGSGLGYQWSRNGTAIGGATAASYSVAAVAYTDEGAQFSVVVTNAQGSVASGSATLHLAPSADQQAFESVTLAANGGSWDVSWLLQSSGGETDVVNYLYSTATTLSASPLTLGPQLGVEGTPTSWSSLLSVPEWKPTWTLIGGVILTTPSTGVTTRYTYVGSAIQVDTLAADNATVTSSELRSGFAYHVLSGLVASAPAALAQPYNVIFSNPSTLSATATFGSGAGYIDYAAHQIGDHYGVFDCLGTETDGKPTPCLASTTLAAALAAGITSGSDGVTYTTASGTLSTVGGIPTWVATAQRPASAIGDATVQYRTYYQIGNDVYTGALTRDGALLASHHDTLSTGTIYFDTQIRLNKAANDSLAAAIAFDDAV
jgi:hypothetical protein